MKVSNNKNNYSTSLLRGDVFVVLAIVGTIFWLYFLVEGVITDAKNQPTHYCKMVELYKKSNGENGWPDFDRRYNLDCIK